MKLSANEHPVLFCTVKTNWTARRKAKRFNNRPFGLIQSICPLDTLSYRIMLSRYNCKKYHGTSGEQLWPATFFCCPDHPWHPWVFLQKKKENISTLTSSSSFRKGWNVDPSQCVLSTIPQNKQPPQLLQTWIEIAYIAPCGFPSTGVLCSRDQTSMPSNSTVLSLSSAHNYFALYSYVETTTIATSSSYRQLPTYSRPTSKILTVWIAA